MEHTTPNKDEIKLLIDNALLQNNEKINKAINDSADKVAKAVNETTSTYLEQLLNVVKAQTEMGSEIDALKSKLNFLWAKMIAVGAACVTLGGFIGFFIELLNNKP